MSLRHWLLLLAVAALGPGSAAAAEPDPAADDEQTLRAADLPTDGPGLLEFLRKRTLADADHFRALNCIRKLGDNDFDVRERASAELRAMGPAVWPLLRDALRDPDLEIAFRAQRCLASIEHAGRPAALGAAVRALGRLKPPGVVAGLLAALPSFDDADVMDDACRALAAVAVRAGTVDGALVAVLADRAAVRRAAAGEALARAGGGDLRPAVHKLLQDPAPAVRQRVALALLEVRDKEAVPALIDLLADLPRERSGTAEETLRLVAGEQAPSLSPGDDEDSRRKCRDAWDGWWKDHGPTLDLAKIDFSHRRLGYTLTALMDGRSTTGRVVEYDAGGKERWQIGGLHYVIDAQMLGDDRVLLAEYAIRLVSERNLKGDILWQYRAGGPVLGARRLANGDTFITARNQLVEVDKDGKEVFNLPRPMDVCAAAKFRDGTIALLVNNGRVLHLDETGKELKALPLSGPVLAVGSNIEALPNGHVLVPLYSTNKVIEIDDDGKTVWEADTQQPTSVARLPNGHTLVGSRLDMTVVDLDHAGREVKSMKLDSRPFRVGGR